MFFRRSWTLILIFVYLPHFPIAARTAYAGEAPPRVLATIKPLHALAAGVMEGVATPDLLLQGNASPHTYALKPSDAAMIERADILFWIGDTLETFLVKALGEKEKQRQAHVVALEDLNDIRLLSIRRTGPWKDGADEHAHQHHRQVTKTRQKTDDPLLAPDPHIWLDPRNAIAITLAMRDSLIEADAAHADRYRMNTSRQIRTLEKLDQDITTMTRDLRNRPFMVFHDGYQYFENRYELKGVGAVVLDPDQPPGVRRIKALRESLTKLGVACIFSEPQFRPALVNTLVEGVAVKVGVLDPLGSGVPPGPTAYETMMRRLTTDFAACLQP